MTDEAASGMPNEENYVFEYSLDQLTWDYLFTSPERSQDLLEFLTDLGWIIIAASLNILLLCTVLSSAKLRNNPSYYFVVQMCAFDIFTLITTLYNAFYFVLRQALIPSPFSLTNQLIFFLSDIAYWGYVTTLSIVSITRLLCVTYPVEFKLHFTTRISLRLLAAGSMIALLLSLPHLHPCCRLLSFPEWHTDAYYPFDTWYRYLDLVVNSTCSVLIICCYSAMFYVMRTSSSYAELRLSSRIREWKLSLQVFLMSAVYLLTFSTYFWLPYLGESRWVTLIGSDLFLVQNITHPLIAFIFNPAIRREAVRLMRIRQRPSGLGVVMAAKIKDTSSNR